MGTELNASSRYGYAWQRLSDDDEKRMAWLDKHIDDEDQDTPAPLPCAVCGRLFKSRIGQKLCKECSRKGLAPVHCLKCGGPVKRWCLYGRPRSRMGMCVDCRSKVPREGDKPGSRRGKKHRTASQQAKADYSRAARKLLARGYGHFVTSERPMRLDSDPG